MEQQSRTAGGFLLALATGIIIGALGGVVWERSQQPWSVVNGSLVTSGNQVLTLRQGPSAVSLSAVEERASVQVVRMSDRVDIVAGDGGAELSMSNSNGAEVRIVTAEQAVTVSAAMGERVFEFRLPAGTDLPTLHWNGASDVSIGNTCTFGPTEVSCSGDSEEAPSGI
jgi:hypothetical protein